MQNQPAQAQPETKNRAMLWAAAIILMALCVIATGWFPLSTITSLPSKNYNEGWNAYRQWMTLDGQPLYGIHPALWNTNYPFLSFHIVGLLAASKANMVPVGRLLCFTSLIATALFVAGIIHSLITSRAAAIYAGLSLFAWLAAFFAAGRAINDPEMLSLAFATFGLYAFLKSPQGSAHLAVSATAFALSLFTKHDLIAIPASIAVHLLITRNWRALAIFLATGAAASCLLLTLSCHLDGRFFLNDLLQPRAYNPQNLIQETLHYLLHFLIPLLIGIAVLLPDRSTPQRGFLLILLIFTNLTAVLFAGGDGVASNIFYAPLIADLLACVIAIHQLENTARPRAFRAALLITTLWAALMVPSQLRNDIIAQSRLPAATNAAQQTITILKSTNGPAICEDLLLCYNAGKPMAYDAYYVHDQIVIGRIQESSILALLTAHHYAAIQIDRQADPASLARRQEGRFTLNFLRVLLAQYQPIMVNQNYSIFVPRSQGSGASRSGITNPRAAGG